MKEAIVDIKMNPHRPKKPASDESTSDEEEMIVYDVEDEIESNPDYVKENDFPLTVNPHKSLNSCRGVISEPDLLSSSEAEILEGLSDQGVTQCQRFGHSQTSCRGQLTCSRCASVGYASTDCSLEPKCINCLQPHPSDSKLCPKWKIEKQIQEIKTTQNISYPEARKLIVPQLPQTYAQATRSSTLNNSTQTVENITKINCPPLKLLAPLSSKQRTNIPTAINTSSSAQTQLLPSISSKTSTTSDPQPPTPISKTEGKFKEDPSPLHQKYQKHIRKKNAREQDSPNETTPVSKKSRRRKTFKVSDAMETDANPSDTDYVTGLASEEDESFLEADFTQAADNLLSSQKSTISNPQPPTPMSETKGKIKEQPSQLHRPRKDNKTIDLLSIKPTPNLKKNPAKNTTLKTAREQDSLNDSTPVSKRSRRRKTSKTSDAMDTDANPSDSDCVIGLASEEDESLLEAGFKKMTDNPLKGPIPPISPKN
ncbi:uncharacterized protein TNCV_4268771 [Trichonephila clavipes]|nr:uncharacterized protein TNCV_4268771 [Trichonephila clavipes]